MAMKEIDILGDLMDATNQEIFGEAFGKEDLVHDETGDRTIEEMGEGLEGQHEPDDDDEPDTDEETGEDESTGEAEADEAEGDGDEAELEQAAKPAKEVVTKPEPEGRVPPGRLREQTERARLAEAERDTLKAERDAERKELAELKGQMTGILAALQRQQQPAKDGEPAKTEVIPDLFEDPKGFVDYLTKGFESKLTQRDQQMDAMRVETSMQIAHSRHGDTFTKAFDAVQKLDKNDPDNRTVVQRIWGSPNPGEALVSWHKRNETLREVGDDPAKYRERLADETRKALMADPEFRKQLIAELRGEASGSNGGKPNTITRLPKSLNGAAGGTNARDPFQYDDSDRAVFSSAFQD